MVQETGLYRFDPEDLAAAYKQFCDWLSRHAGEEQRPNAFGPFGLPKCITPPSRRSRKACWSRNKERDIKGAINDLARASRWLKEQENGTVELCPWSYTSNISPQGE